MYLLLGVLGTFKAYPSLSDPGLFLTMTALFPETFPRTSHPHSPFPHHQTQPKLTTIL